MPTSLVHIYIQKWKLHISGITRFPFHCESASQSLCQMAEVLVGLGSFQVKKKEGSDKKRQKKKQKNIKEAPFLPLWLLWVTAWSAISSSPTEAVSCAAGRQPERPPAPRTLAAGAGGPCSTWPRPGMTSAGRGKWRGRGGGGTVSSHRLQTQKHTAVFHHFLFVNEHLNWSFCWLRDWRRQALWWWRVWRDNIQNIQCGVMQTVLSNCVLNIIKKVGESEKLQSILCGRQQKVNQVFNLKMNWKTDTHLHPVEFFWGGS